jgi:hypothetical protein
VKLEVLKSFYIDWTGNAKVRKLNGRAYKVLFVLKSRNSPEISESGTRMTVFSLQQEMIQAWKVRRGEEDLNFKSSNLQKPTGDGSFIDYHTFPTVWFSLFRDFKLLLFAPSLVGYSNTRPTFKSKKMPACLPALPASCVCPCWSFVFRTDVMSFTRSRIWPQPLRYLARLS